MPNWVKNSISFTCDNRKKNAIKKAQEILQSLISVEDVEEGRVPCCSARNDFKFFDFEKVIPIPKEEKDAYTWHTKNWSTKWNAHQCTFDFEGDRVARWSLNFYTAWSMPFNILAKLSQMLGKDFKIFASFADEDLGNNCGIYVFTAEGDVYQASLFDEGTEEAKDWATNFWSN